MRQVLGPLALGLAIVLTGLTPLAQAHAAPDPLDNSVHVLADEGEDSFYWYDGYDLYNLFVREAYAQALDEEGLILRYTLYGGFSPASDADQLAVDIQAVTADGDKTFTITTTDDENWEGDMAVLVANVTEDDPPFTGVTANMQTFVSYDQLGVEPGATVEEIRMVSRADDDVRDIAPGGFMIPNSQGEGEVPAESERLVDELELAGPHGYLDASARPTQDGLVVDVESTLENGQHVTVDLKTPPGWNATLNGSAQASLPAGETVSFPVEAEATPDAGEPLSVHVKSDLGAHEQLYTGVNGSELTTASTAQAVDVDPAEPEPNESPAPAGLLVLALFAALAMVVGRRER
jgi:hypothetical protein